MVALLALIYSGHSCLLGLKEGGYYPHESLATCKLYETARSWSILTDNWHTPSFLMNFNKLGHLNGTLGK